MSAPAPHGTTLNLAQSGEMTHHERVIFIYDICQGRGQELMEGVFLLFFPPPLPFHPPLFPFPLPPLPYHFPSLSFPSSLLPLPHPFPSFPPFSPPLRSRATLNQLGDLGERCKLPRGAQAKNEFGAL